MFLRGFLVCLVIAFQCASLQAHAAGMVLGIQPDEPEANTLVAPMETGKQLAINRGGALDENEAKEENPIHIASHRAIYTMALASAKNGSNISDVSGRMLFEWVDGCDGWAVQQHMQLRFGYAEGDESDITSTVVSWEGKDGTRYHFNVRRVAGGKETEVYRGRARIEDDGGVADYTVPKETPSMALPSGTLFPSAHTILILKKALAGEKFFTRRVFDGSDEDAMADISAFIGPENDKLKLDTMPPELSSKPLLAQKAWPVRLAFFEPETETGESDYEMDIVLQENGIARSMLIDYGEFAVSGTLSDLETIPTDACH